MKGRISLPHRLKKPDGPGQVGDLQVATLSVFLRSAHDPDIILGRPTVVGLTDNWGRYFYALSFTFANTPRTSIALALEAALTNKQEFCASFGVSIGADVWPVATLPETILVERGLAGSVDTKRIARELGIQFASAQSRESILTDLLVRHCGTVVKPLTNPGDPTGAHTTVQKYRSAPDQVLTVREFQQLLIHMVLNYHQSLLMH